MAVKMIHGFQHDGFEYRLNKISLGQYTYNCSEFRKKCRAKARITVEVNGNRRLIVYGGPHNHPSLQRHKEGADRGQYKDIKNESANLQAQDEVKESRDPLALDSIDDDWLDIKPEIDDTRIIPEVKLEKSPRPNRLLETSYKCTQCSYMARTPWDFRRHSLTHDIDGNLPNLVWFNDEKKKEKTTVVKSHESEQHSVLVDHNVISEVPSLVWYGKNKTTSPNGAPKEPFESEPTTVYACQHCCFNASSLAHLHGHHLTMHRGTLLRCYRCRAPFMTYYSLRAHRFACPKVSCCVCSKVFPAYSQLLRHQKQNHSKRLDLGMENMRTRRTKREVARLLCEICGFVVKTESRLRCHMRKHMARSSSTSAGCASLSIN